MIWGYPYFRKPPYGCIMLHTLERINYPWPPPKKWLGFKKGKGWPPPLGRSPGGWLNSHHQQPMIWMFIHVPLKQMLGQCRTKHGLKFPQFPSRVLKVHENEFSRAVDVSPRSLSIFVQGHRIHFGEQRRAEFWLWAIIHLLIKIRPQEWK